MSKSIKKIVLPVVLAVMLLVSACVTQTPTAQPTNPPEPTAAPNEPTVEEPTTEPTEAVVVEPTAEPIVIVDVIGREITLEKPATKLVGTVGVSHEGVDFNSLDGDKVHLFYGGEESPDGAGHGHYVLAVSADGTYTLLYSRLPR